jgi:hypothetical protein
MDEITKSIPTHVRIMRSVCRNEGSILISNKRLDDSHNAINSGG